MQLIKMNKKWGSLYKNFSPINLLLRMFGHRIMSSKARDMSRSFQVPALFTILILVLVASMLFFGHSGEKPDSPVGLVNQKWNSFESLVQFNPTVRLRNGTNLIWQIPNLPKGVLFIAHGCNGQAANFWDKSSTCPDCVGLPEERLITLHALARKFAVLTVSSVGVCWSFVKERLIVEGIIKWWVEEHKLEKLPLVALGASSGGYFVSALANYMRFNSIVLMIAEGVFDRMDIRKDYPPTLFVHMPKDETRKRKIDAYVEILRDEGIDVAEVKCVQFPLTQNFLADRVRGVSEAISKKLFALFQRKGFVDKDGYMTVDGRAIHLKTALRESKIKPLDMGLFHHIQEELNLAFAYHEMTSLQSDQIFDWFESHIKSSRL